MIGQKHLLELIDAMQFQLPHFIILVGPRGSGKTCLTKYIADKLEAVYSVTDIKVDATASLVSGTSRTSISRFRMMSSSRTCISPSR